MKRERDRYKIHRRLFKKAFIAYLSRDLAGTAISLMADESEVFAEPRHVLPRRDCSKVPDPYVFVLLFPPPVLTVRRHYFLGGHVHPSKQASSRKVLHTCTCLSQTSWRRSQGLASSFDSHPWGPRRHRRPRCVSRPPRCDRPSRRRKCHHLAEKVSESTPARKHSRFSANGHTEYAYLALLGLAGTMRRGALAFLACGGVLTDVAGRGGELT